MAPRPAVIEGIYSLGITADNTAIIEAMSYNGSVTAADGASFPIDGLNKTYYWHDPSGQESHTNTIQMYNDLWGSSSRGHSDNTEVLIGADGTVEQISRRSTFPFEVPDGKTILQVNGTAKPSSTPIARSAPRCRSRLGSAGSQLEIPRRWSRAPGRQRTHGAIL